MDDTRSFSNLTEDTDEDAPWIDGVEQKPELESKLVALLRFLTTLLRLFTQLINGTFSFSI